MKDQNLLTPAAIAGQLSEGWVHRWTQCSTMQRRRAEATTLVDGIWQSQLITTARLEYAIRIAYGKEVRTSEKSISKPMPADYGVAPNKVNLRQAYA